MPQVSVIMPVYDGEAFLAEAIESILAQTLTDFELLVVDDGSQDASAEIINTYAERDSRIRFFQLERNAGTADACNHAISMAQGHYCTRMDCDDVSLPQRLQRQVEFLQCNPEIGGVGAHRQVMNQDLSTILYPHILSQQHALIVLDWFINHMFMGATLMLRLEFIREIGGFQPGLRRTEDLELVARLFDQTSIRFANLPEVLYLHRRHEFNVDTSPGSAAYNVHQELLTRVLERALNDEPGQALEQVNKLRTSTNLSWAERRASKHVLKRLIESMIAHNWVEPDDRPLLIAEMNRRLERVSPRRWQQFCHWRRHHFQRRERI